MSGSNANTWTRPDELLKLQRLYLKKKQLTARLAQIARHKKPTTAVDESHKTKLLENKLQQKRANPFAKNNASASKRLKTENEQDLLNNGEDTLYNFVSASVDQLQQTTSAKSAAVATNGGILKLQPFDAEEFRQLLTQQQNVAQQQQEDDLTQQKLSKFLPMDWSIKTRVRFFCQNDLPATNLRSTELASGLTSFVRCLDTQSYSCNNLDISTGTRFNQATYYWQHPHIPWLTLFPRNSKDNVGISIGARERAALATDWDYSFAGLFQLLRARQCPYFYLCANAFTVLFRAAGTAGCAEMHALMTPSSRGMRQALRKEGIEYVKPFKQNNKAADNSWHNDVKTQETDQPNAIEQNDDDDDDTGEDWLQSLGVAEAEIRRIQAAEERKAKVKETLEDFTDSSLLLIEGVECQSFFNFVLNAKTTVANIGRLAGVPPTLLAPVAFPKATLLHATARSNKVRNEGVDYCSIEVKGIILPTFMPNACQLLCEQQQTFSAQMVSNNWTLAFTKATQKMLQTAEQKTTANTQQQTDQVFVQENLADCGLRPHVITAMCRTQENAVGLIERICYDKQHGYAWT